MSIESRSEPMPDALNEITRKEFLSRMGQILTAIGFASAFPSGYYAYQGQREIDSNTKTAGKLHNNKALLLGASFLTMVVGLGSWGMTEEQRYVNSNTDPEEDDVVVEALMPKSGSKDQIR